MKDPKDKEVKNNSKSNNSRSSRNTSKNNRRSRKYERTNSNVGKPQEPESIPHKDEINDSSFYYKDKELLTQMTNYSFDQFAGINFKVGEDFSGNNLMVYDSVPTIMVIDINPSVGSTPDVSTAIFGADAAEGVQRAALRNFTIFSSGNMKNTMYTPGTVTFLLTAFSSILEEVSYIQRFFGTVMHFNMRNRDLPRNLIESQNMDYDDLIANLADYRLQFNTLLNGINKIPIPENIAMFKKSSAMYSAYFKDDDSPYAQIYVIRPHSLWSWDETNNKLVTIPPYGSVPLGQTPTMADHLGMLNNMINNLLSSALFNYVYSDIMRVADKTGMRLNNFSALPEGWTAPIVYSDEFNLWIDNATIIGEPVTTAPTSNFTNSNDVTENITTGLLEYAPAFKVEDAFTRDFIMLNFTHNDPNVEERVAATRLANLYAPGVVSAGGVDYQKAILSDHYIVSMTLMYRNVSGNVAKSTVKHSLLGMSSTDTYAHLFSNIILFSMLSKFRFKPNIQMINSDDLSANSPTRTMSARDYDYYTNVSYKYLARMYNAEFLHYYAIEE